MFHYHKKLTLSSYGFTLLINKNKSYLAKSNLNILDI